MTSVLWSLSAAAALVYWAMSLREGVSLSRSLIKGLGLVPLVIIAVLSGAPMVAFALAFCSLGDVCLSRPGERAFLAGLSAFALGHLVWIAVFVLGFESDVLAALTGHKWIVLIGMAVLAFVMARKLLPNAGALRLPVATYICIIMAMGLVALATPSWTLLVGAILFMASDTLLGLQVFVLTPGTPRERLANALIWPLYWGAIVVLVIATIAA